jgi:hypothetical protein
LRHDIKDKNMGTLEHAYEHFFTRDGFNSSLGHFQAVADLIPGIQKKENLADLLNEKLGQKEVQLNQLSPIVYALLVDKYGYAYDSNNMKQTMDSFDELHDAIKGWNAVDLVLTYIHPELGYQVVNPKNKDHWDSFDALRKNELVTIYAGGMDKGADPDICRKAVDTFIDYLNGKIGKSPALLTSGPFKPVKSAKPVAPKKTPRAKSKPGRPSKSSPAVAQAAPAPEPAPQETGGGNRRMTPFYSVPVTNELFHNGNVEAWKRIIMSYQTKHPGLDVYIFYEGERIHDIHALFKWGKVKHGSTIVFAVAGSDIKDVAKLQRYLRQGASPRFEDFLRFPVNTVLNLF